MKLNKALFVSSLLALVLAACSGNGKKAETSDSITEFAVNQTLITADSNYRVETDYGNVYLELYTSLQWPEAMGSHDIKPLRDSILSFAYGDTVSTSVREAVGRFIHDTSVVESARRVVPVDTLPTDSMTYFNSVVATVIDLDEEMITYQLTSASYLGGAHPLSTVIPFTYDFAEARVLDFSSIFLPEVKADSVMPIIREAIARQYSVPVNSLERAGFFASQLTYPGKPYIANNALYFHYDPYEIGPYSLGQVDVAVYPYEVDRYLRPSVKRLFDQGF